MLVGVQQWIVSYFPLRGGCEITIKVAIADSHPAVRFAVQTLVTLMRETEFVGEAESAEEALTIFGEIEPDLVVLDLYLKRGSDGTELCRQLKGSPASPKVLVYSAYDTGEVISSVLLAGADSYLHKSVGNHELQRAILDTCAGKRVWKLDPEERDSELRGRLLAAASSPLTRKESETLTLMLRRYSNKDIACELCVSLATVKSHVRNILRKIGVSNRTELF
jgi:DNA-binding NarL/FixJ family response regulator